MTHWIFSSKEEIFRLDEYLNSHDEVDWICKNLIEVGDIVFIYCSRPTSAIKYKMIVTKTNIPYDESINDEEYWNIKHRSKDEVKEKIFIRLKIIGFIPSDKLTLSYLKEIGINGNLQGPRRISGSILEIISNAFEEFSWNVPFDVENVNYVEGGKLNPTIDRYERNPKAREICIKHYGCKCQICGLDFSKKYGKVGSGFIHVHHIKPLSSFNSKHNVNPLIDLIPVCPNCHYMLHRKIDGKYLSVDELKEIVKRNRTENKTNSY